MNVCIVANYVCNYVYINLRMYCIHVYILHYMYVFVQVCMYVLYFIIQACMLQLYSCTVYVYTRQDTAKIKEYCIVLHPRTDV